MPNQITIYTTSYCPYCVRAKQLLSALHVPFTEIDVENDPVKREELTEKYNWKTVPMIIVGDEFIGGYDDMAKLHAEGKLMDKING